MFKIGDKVRRVGQGNYSDSTWERKKDKIYTITRYDEYNDHAKTDYGNAYTIDYFKGVYSKGCTKILVGGELL